MTRLRCPGGSWRLLVHEPGATSHHVTSDRRFGRANTGDRPDTELSRTHELPGTEFDELVVGRWLHIEEQDTGLWWMSVGGVVLHVRVDREGRPTHVRVDGPGDWDEPVPGCSYQHEWSAS